MTDDALCAERARLEAETRERIKAKIAAGDVGTADTSHAQQLVRRAVYFKYIGDHQRCEAALRDAVGCDPSNHEARCLLVHVMSEHAIEEAVAILSEGLARAPHDIELRTTQAWLLGVRNRVHDAERCIRAVLREAPHNFLAQQYRAELLWTMGHMQEGMRLFDESRRRASRRW